MNNQTNKLIPELRFSEFVNDGEWEEEELGNLLNYLQPTDYIVSSTTYNDKYKTPVLTAGKTFVLGYTDEISGIFENNLPVIIFDDFTTASKFVDFPFKVKSSAMKILLAKKHSNIKFIYESIQTIKYEIGVHGRHWISAFSILKIPIPNSSEQKKIADCLSSLDEVITAHTNKLETLKTYKKGLMQNLFPQEGEKVPKLRFKEFEKNEEWKKKTIQDIAKVTTGNKDTQNKVEDGKYPFFVRSQTVERINSFSYDGEAILTSGDGVGVGKNFHYINGKFDYHQRVYCIYNFSEDVSGEFIYMYFSQHFNDRVMRMSAKNSVDSVRMAMITEMPISLPQKKEQQKIASSLSYLDEIIQEQSNKIEQLKSHKKGLMQGLFPKVKK